MIQKAFNESIGPDNNNNFIFSSQYNIEKKNQENNNDKENENLYNNPDNLNKQSLLDYLKKENEELKKLNNSYKQLLDTLFYFLNNISRPYQKPDDNSQNNSNSPKLFDLSKDLKNLDGLSQKLINLEFLMNDNKDKKLNNKNGKNNIKKNDGNNDSNGANNDNNDINNNNKDNKNYIINDEINNKNKKKPLLLSITKENSLQLPEQSKLLQFNDLIEGMNEKCFSFKNDNFIERYKKNSNNNNINNKKNINNKNDDNKKNMSNIDNNINLDNDILNMINNDSDRCVACLMGCNVSKRGYSPMKYNPYMKKVLRVDDSGDLLDRYYELKENMDKEDENTAKKNINYIKKIPRSRDNSKRNILDNNKSNNSMKTQKKIWK
jgi:hypothetical protein